VANFGIGTPQYSVPMFEYHINRRRAGSLNPPFHARWRVKANPPYACFMGIGTLVHDLSRVGAIRAVSPSGALICCVRFHAKSCCSKVLVLATI